jgi:predicted permease
MGWSQLLASLFRAIRHKPGAYLSSVLILATGVGSVVAMFSIYSAVVLNPISVHAPEQLVDIQTVNPKVNNVPITLSWVRYDNSLRHSRSFSQIAAYDNDAASLTAPGEAAEQVQALRVTSSFFPTLGIEAMHGRLFTSEDDQPNGPNACVLSHEFWQSRFGGQPMVGRVITLDGRGTEVIGVLPPRFTVPWSDRQIFLPRLFETSTTMPENIRNGSSYLSVIGRLKPGVTIEQAQAELDGLARGYSGTFAGKMDAANSTKAISFVQSTVSGNRQTLLVLLSAVAAVLAVACANASTLFLGRLLARQRETAVRQALGASRAVIVRQFLLESLGLSLVAGTAGVAVAWGLVRVVTISLGASFPPGTVIAINGRALIVALGVVSITSLLVGLLPALYVTRPSMSPLISFARGESSASTGGRLRALLVLAEVALSCVLLIGASMLVASLVRLQSASPGFDTQHTGAGLISLPPARYASPERQAAFVLEAVNGLRQAPGVQGAAAVFGLPLGPGFTFHQYVVAGQPIPPPSQRERAGIRLVTEDYFAVMGIRLKSGRFFTDSDRAGAPGVCIVNSTLAKRLFQGNALGQAILRGRDANLRYEIVGIVEDVRSYGLRSPAVDEIYYPLRQLPWPQFALVAKSTSDPAALRQSMERAVAAVDPAQPVAQFATMEQRLTVTQGSARMIASIALAFAVVALAMAMVGLYAVLSQGVASRTAEIGVRIALGATPGDVAGMILRNGMALVLPGVAAGVAVSLAGAQFLASQLFLVNPRDPWIIAGVSLAFGLAGAVACMLPSWRAARLDPLNALRRV